MIIKLGHMDISIERVEKGLREITIPGFPEETMEIADGGVRVKNLSSDFHNAALFVNQTEDFLAEQLEKDFNKLLKYYIKKTHNGIDVEDIERVTFSIVLHAFYVYNGWRGGKGLFKNISVKFRWWWDLNHPQTYDILFWYFQKKFPDAWLSKAALMIGVSPKKCEKIWKQRKAFADMW